ncbi:MAG TPA: SGNH/GDSL hydrolase family protein [Sphingomonas sp.]
MRIGHRLAVAGLALLCLPAATGAPRWIGAFGAPPIGYEPGRPKDALNRPLANETARQIVRVGAGGTALRIRLSNELNDQPLRIGAASIARVDAQGAIVPGTLRPLTFGGAAGVTIPSGAPYFSDPVEGAVAADTDYAISLYYPETSTPPAHAQMIDLAPGDQTLRPMLDQQARIRAPGLVTGIDVETPGRHPVLVAYGDSITEGAASTPGAHMSWPEQLGRRLGTACWSVVNQGISGNRILFTGRGPSALARFDRDALSVPGVNTIVLLEGINDIGSGHDPKSAADDKSVEELIAADRQMIARAHAKGIRIIGGTLTPFEGAAYADEKGEAKRVALNHWIRTGGAFDAVIDFEAAVRDPAHPARMIPADEHGDHLHPDDAGYTLMAQAAEPVIRRLGCPAD